MDGAKNMIQSYFDSVHPDNLLHLLNQPITSFHPKTIIYKEGQQIEYAGNFIGEEYIYDARQAKLTYRTGSYVNVLSIPIAVIDNLKKRASYEKFELMIKEYMEKIIYLLYFGRIQLKIGPHDALITLDSGDFFGENIIHDFKPLTHFYPEDIPVIFQQLNEQYQKIYITVAGFLQKHEASAHFSPAVYTQPAQMMSSGGYVLYHLYQLAEYLYSVGDRVLLIRVLYNLSRYYKKYTERVRIRMMRYRSSESHTLMNAHDKITVSLDNLYKGIADGRFGDEDLQSLRKNIIICIDQINHNPVM
ncbi:hypothetical protein CHS0354_006906 [Potamilus streckersoni]|uniref:Uncharacterized protein n=1 Tax=Potamilus streckersoni TaxID=2493646 RepID=A0AAE0WD16_9BIVA|nr:hypothetical protein CHS0354_006906 [Potamilus streckersoni]